MHWPEGQKVKFTWLQKPLWLHGCKLSVLLWPCAAAVGMGLHVVWLLWFLVLLLNPTEGQRNHKWVPVYQWAPGPVWCQTHGLPSGCKASAQLLTCHVFVEPVCRWAEQNAPWQRPRRFPPNQTSKTQTLATCTYVLRWCNITLPSSDYTFNPFTATLNLTALVRWSQLLA